MMDIAVALCVAVALVLACLRMWEQSRLKKATNRLVRSHSEFDRVLDRLSEHIGVDDDKSSAPTINHGLWHYPHGNLRRAHHFTCRVRRGPPTIVTTGDDLWMRMAFNRIATEQFLKETDPEATWIFQDESEYEPALR
jgi:hypothetical protein